MSISTYAELKTAIADFLDRDDLTANIDTFIDLAESYHKRDIRIPEMISRESITVNARQISLPTGFIEPISFRLLTNPVTVLKQVNLHEMNRNRFEVNGKPTLFSITGEIEFDKTPDDSYSGEIIFWKEETALSDANTSNNILARAPDVYLYGALVHTAPFPQEDSRIAVWASLYSQGVRQLNSSARKSRRSSPQVSRVSGSTP